MTTNDVPRRAGPPPQHPHEHRPEGPILLAVDQEPGECAALRVAPELSDPVGPLEVGEHQDLEQLGAASRPEGVEALPESAFKLVGSHGRSLATSYARLRRVVVVFDAVQRVILGDGVSLPLGDGGLQQVAPADKADEDVE